MKFSDVKNKLWFDLFQKIGIIFVVFVTILTVANGTMLVSFFCFKEKMVLKEQLLVISELDFNNSTEITDKLSEISEKYNFEAEIYDNQGKILYTTRGSQMLDFFTFGNPNFSMTHEVLTPIKSEKMGGGVVFQIAQGRTKMGFKEYLLCYKEISKDIFAEVRIQKELLSNSASVANQFIIIISSLCFILSILWVVILAKKFSKPIVEMNEITHSMSKLNFGRTLTVNRKDEIGQLAHSINNMSDSLSEALIDLKEKNQLLRSEIEAERQLDVMRRAFVANVSHELKTPISIVNGYAEGLKLNINEGKREEYCNTIIDESNRMNKLVLSILELSKYESGQIKLDIQKFDISSMCDDMLKRIFKQTDISVINLIPPATMVNADPIQIEQVIKSYFENAKSHTTKKGEVTVASQVINGKLRISVFNTGSHIEEEKMPHIWQSFYRGDSSHKRENTRFGLGLSIVGAIMKMHSSSCGVYNTQDGVCFWFELILD